jgi:hypothetical protein
MVRALTRNGPYTTTLPTILKMKNFIEKASEEYRDHRNNFRDCYAYIEHYCKKKYNSGNYLDLLSETTSLTETCKKEISEIIKQDYIKSNNYNFEVRPNVKSATDFLRNKILGKNIEHVYNKSLERAIYELLQVLRDNITHYGKLEHSNEQYNRNLILIKNASLITCSLVQDLDIKK